MTAADLIAELAPAIIAQTSAARQATHSYRIELENVPAGETEFALRVDVLGYDNVLTEDASSNVVYEVVEVQIQMLHRLADVFDEAGYRDGARLTDQETLAARAFWMALASVYAVQELETTEDTTRTGAVLSYIVGARIKLTP